MYVFRFTSYHDRLKMETGCCYLVLNIFILVPKMARNWDFCQPMHVSTARGIIYEWENYGIPGIYHEMILRKFDLWPAPFENELRRRESRDIRGILRSTYSAAGYDDSRRRWLEAHSLALDHPFRKVLAMAEPIGYRSHGDVTDENVFVDCDNPVGPTIMNARPRRKQLSDDKTARLIMEMFRRGPGTDPEQYESPKTFDKGTQTDTDL